MTDNTPFNDDGDDNIQTSLTVQADAQKRKKYIYGGVALMLTFILIIVIIVATTSGNNSSSSSSSNRVWPIVVATWDKKSSADAAWVAMVNSETPYQALDGVVKGVQYCQSNCNVNQQTGLRSANFDTEGKVTQSAMVMYGPTYESGSVSGLYDIDDAVGVAKAVLIYTKHAMLVGEAATRFAVQNGFTRRNLQNASYSDATVKYDAWLSSGCTSRGPYWRNTKNGVGCTLVNGTYEQDTESSLRTITGCDANETEPTGAPRRRALDGEAVSAEVGDGVSGGMVTGSVAIIAIDKNGEIALATSSNGQQAQIAGRVSDAAVPGAAGYIDQDVGACTATGDGDVIIRFAAAKTAVTFMKTGMSPQDAAQAAVDEIENACPNNQAIILCLTKDGEPGIANNEPTGKPKYAYRSDACTAAVSADVDNPRGGCS